MDQKRLSLLLAAIMVALCLVGVAVWQAVAARGARPSAACTPATDEGATRTDAPRGNEASLAATQPESAPEQTDMVKDGKVDDPAPRDVPTLPADPQPPKAKDCALEHRNPDFKPEQWDSGGALTGQAFARPPRDDETSATITLSGTTVDNRHEPVPGCLVYFYLFTSAGGQPPSRIADRADCGFSDMHGKFRIRITCNIPVSGAGHIELFATKKGRLDGELTSVPIQPGASVSGLVLIVPNSVSAALKLVYADGAPVKQARANLIAIHRDKERWINDVDDWRFAEGFRPVGEKSDDAGRLLYDPIAPGRYKLYLEQPGWTLEDFSREFLVPADGLMPVDLGEVRLVRGAHIRGVLADSRVDLTKDIRLALRIPWRLTILDAEGRPIATREVNQYLLHVFYIGVPDLAPGTYRLQIDVGGGYELLEIPNVSFTGDNIVNLGVIKLKFLQGG